MDNGCCWHKEQIAPEDCPYVRPGESELLLNRKKRILKRCFECPHFMEGLKGLDKDPGDPVSLVPCLLDELQALRIQTRELSGQIEVRNREVKFLHEVSLVLQTSVDRDEVIAMALTAVTSGKGFGLNRAILLLVDKERHSLKGYFAVGPGKEEDAGRLWREIEDHNYTLREMARLFFEQRMAAEREKFKGLLEKLSTPLSRGDHLFIRTLNGQLSRHVEDLSRESGIDPEQIAALGVTEVVLVPLVSKERRIGLLIADNVINRRPISTEDLHSLETFALPVSFAIERAALYERLQEELVKLTEAHQRLQDQQELILRMEKMALVGKITANIAHSIRNPLTIIGGFARSLIKNIPPEDEKRRHIESIVREARRLEEVLQEVLNYSESLHPTFDLWDVNQLATGVYGGLREDLELSGIDCRLDLQPGLPMIQLDYKKMVYCLRSIINNAIEALPRGGSLGIRTSGVGDDLQITVTDSGPGISPDVLRSVTSPFFSTKEEGSGLGLSLCARILEAHGATLDIEGCEGDGTAFTIHMKTPKEENHGSTSGG
ncbi:ATP-binding protein [uncultured Desulfuromonas sp.]|uniref:ATP-binding protein n=1 Tax=uncultured Desulfuromonas sp. TaxID=181013 RepID=UPI0026152021|nr:ATP-binding protein [uncultured Desulfuromonas sp.]